ncbi:hypothetical protein OH768_47775 [Streptomyces sp. NBC_01622]|uniref:hypothetical protein n=1 Tax=Streptomyces sp. NBC_01622 TaxID=2975903 RepID=UPI00386AEE15|nr:hypothetical protein OH768_47775 [Streptomyces sp. NBC_01622]
MCSPPAQRRRPRRRPPRRTAERTDKDSSLSEHFRLTSHPEHGYVAEADPQVPGHLADWLLTREQFEPIPGASGRYRLIHPHHDGLRRTRQAAQDLRRLGYRVHTAAALTPARTPGPPQPGVNNGLLEHRARIAQAAATRSPRNPAAPATPLPEVTPQTAAVPGGGRARAAGGGRGR